MLEEVLVRKLTCHYYQGNGRKSMVLISIVWPLIKVGHKLTFSYGVK